MIDAQRLAGLVASRICHDLISPIGAIGNGLELIRAEGKAGEDELSLIEDCARSASATLAYHRVAFGAAGPTDRFDLDDAARAARDFLSPRRIECDWAGRRGGAPKIEAKALLLTLLAAAEALPRGGRITAASGDALGWTAEGVISPRVDELLARILATETPENPAPGQVHTLLLPQVASALGRKVYARVVTQGDASAFEVGFA